jgi:hypothetical protein
MLTSWRAGIAVALINTKIEDPDGKLVLELVQEE